MSGFMDRVRAALGSRRDDAPPRAPAAIPLGTVVAEGDAREAASVDPVALEALRRRAECSPNGVFALFALASLDTRVAGIPSPLAFNNHGHFEGALAGVRLANGLWRLEGDRDHLHEALRWALPGRPSDIARYVLRATLVVETDHRVAAFTNRMKADATVAAAVGAVARRLPRHALLAALSAPERALAGLGVEGTPAELVGAVLALGVGVDEPLSEGLPTALACAAARGDAPAVAALLAAGGDPSAHTFGRGPAHDAAALAGSAETVRLLSAAGYRFDAVDEDGLNGLHFLLHGPWTEGINPPPGIDGMHNFRDRENFLALVDAGANPRQRSEFDVSPIEFLRKRSRSPDSEDRHFGEAVLGEIDHLRHASGDRPYLGEEIDGDGFELCGGLTIGEADLERVADSLVGTLQDLGAHGGYDPVRALRGLGWKGSLADGGWTFEPTGEALAAGRWDVDREELLSALAASGFEGSVTVVSCDRDMEVAYYLAGGTLSAEPRERSDEDETGYRAAP